jgi:hypothetical protein
LLGQQLLLAVELLAAEDGCLLVEVILAEQGLMLSLDSVELDACVFLQAFPFAQQPLVGGAKVRRTLDGRWSLCLARGRAGDWSGRARGRARECIVPLAEAEAPVEDLGLMKWTAV